MGTRTLTLTQGRVAIVDEEDYERLAAWKWTLHSRGDGAFYAKRRRHSDGKTIKLHKAVLDVDEGLEVDHKNGDGLDCRRENLRAVTHAQNMRNQRARADGSSIFKGVARVAHHVKTGRGPAWRACITVDYKQRRLGRFESEYDAGMAYDAAAHELHGEFARTNGLHGPRRIGHVLGLGHVPQVWEDGGRESVMNAATLPWQVITEPDADMLAP